ncbi:MAG: porin family protein [Verrucomicrobia bacterium]|nr:porin family protein [Verrucomicrobiota bacterium]
MKRALVWVLVIAAAALVCFDAQAQQGRRLTVQPRLSYWVPDDADNAFGVGASAEIMLSDWFGLTGGIDFWGFEGDSLSSTLDVFPDWDIRDLSVGIVFYIGYSETINPYITAGLDYFFIGDDFGGADAGAFGTAGVDDSIGWHIGGGLDIALSGNFSIVIEARYFDTSIDVDLSEIEVGDVEVTGFAALVGVEIGF